MKTMINICSIALLKDGGGFLRFLIPAIFLIAMIQVNVSAQVPARFYWKSLSNSNALPVLGMAINGNTNPADPAHIINSDGDFSGVITMFGYARTFSLCNRAGMVAVLLPTGKVSGGASLGGKTFDQAAGGFGDPMIEFDINVVGPKAIKNIPDMIRYEPGFSLDIMGDIVFPIGEYDSDKLVNIGQNRWYGRIGTPIVWQLGKWVPGKRTTLELLPSVWFYGKNKDYAGHTMETNPMFQLDAHITRDFITNFWGSLDAGYYVGAKATIDTVEGEKLNNVAIGLTLGYHINDNIQATFGYMATINDKNAGDLQLNGFRFSILCGWHKVIEGMKRLKSDG